MTVNTANAGKGRLTARMQPVRGGTQPLDVEVGDNGDGTFTVYFTPILAEPHAIRLMYGGRDIPDGAWTMQVCIYALYAVAASPEYPPLFLHRFFL